LEELKAARDERYLALVEGRIEDFDVDPAAFEAGGGGAIERVIERHPRQKVAVVCHGGVINAYVGHILEIARPMWFEPGYTSIHRIAASRGGVRSVVSLNEMAHLRPVH